MKKRYKFEIPFLAAVGVFGFFCSAWIRESFVGTDRVAAYLLMFGTAFVILRGVHWLVARHIGND